MHSFKIIITLLFISIFSTSFAQEKLNKYKYILIENNSSKEKLEKRRKSFNISPLLKSHLNNRNFVAFIQGTDTVPTSIDPCNILRAKINDSGFTVTKISIEFSDCYGNNIYTTENGISRIKDFKASYFDAFQETLSDKNIEDHVYIDENKQQLKHL